MSRSELIVNTLLETEDEEVQRYLDLVKPPHRRIYALRNMYCDCCGAWCSQAEQKKYKVDPNQCPSCLHRPVEQKVRQKRVIESESVEQKLKAVAKTIKHCGDYGHLYYHPGNHEVHWTAGDADGPPEGTDTREIAKLLKLPGIKHVEIGDEWSPKDAGWKRLNEDEEPDARDEVDRLLPTSTYRLGGNTMIHAPGVIRMAQSRWRERSKKAKQNGMDIIRSWPGLPDEVYLKILNGDCWIDTDGDTAVVTVKDY